MFRTSILGKLGPPFQQSFTPKLLRAFQWSKATLSIGTGFEFPQISIKTDFSHRSRLFTGLRWLPAILLFAWSTPNTLRNLRVRMRCIYPPPSNSFSSPKYTLANEAARSIPLIIPATSRTSPYFTHLRSRPNARYGSAVQIARSVLGLSCWTATQGC